MAVTATGEVPLAAPGHDLWNLRLRWRHQRVSTTAPNGLLAYPLAPGVVAKLTKRV